MPSNAVPVQAPGPISIPPAVQKTYDALSAHPAVQKAFTALKSDDGRALEEMKTITGIPAPPFHEARRAAYLLQCFHELGLADARIDAEGNVTGRRRGAQSDAPLLALCAHLDTVFPEGTDLTIVERDGMLCAPGISDDARGLATLLAVLKIMQEEKLETVGDVLFVGTVGEEELGDLRGVKALLRDFPDIDGFISIDVSDLSRVVYAATGSRRYDIVYKGPGGHSFNAYGVPSATHALGRAIAKIADLDPPATPKTTFTVGIVHGGTTINAIAAEAHMGIDMRSNDMAALEQLEQRVLALAQDAADEENRRWNSDALTVECQRVGDRPAGTLPTDSIIVHSARCALRAVGCELKTLAAASTDSNVPIALGIPSLTIGIGGESGGAHSLKEWYRHKDAYLAAQNALLLVLGLSGFRDVVAPLLEKRRARHRDAPPRID